MVEEGPYEILPYDEINKLKKQIDDLRKKTASSGEVLDSINRLTRIMESMLNLFESAASRMKKEGGGYLDKKINKLLDQHEILAESTLILRNMIEKLKSKVELSSIAEESESESILMREKLRPIAPVEPPPSELTRGFEPKTDFYVPPIDFGRQRQMPRPQPPHAPMPQRPPREGPVPMPTGSFKDLNLEMPETQGFYEYAQKEQSSFVPRQDVSAKQKKGLFGKFKQ